MKHVNWNIERTKEFHCRQCSSFLDTHDLINGCCPNCENDEDLFINELKE